jgi:hypothetical protein
VRGGWTLLVRRSYATILNSFEFWYLLNFILAEGIQPIRLNAWFRLKNALPSYPARPIIVRALYDESKRIWPTGSGRKIKCIISIGTGEPPLRAVGERGLELVSALREIALDAEQTAREFRDEMEHLPDSEDLTYVRLNASQAVADIGLEEWKHFDRLTGATNDYLNNHIREVEKCAVLTGSE